MKKWSMSPKIFLLLLSFLLVVGIFVSLCLGRFKIPFNPKLWTPQMITILKNLRLPRILLSCLVGCCLSAAGVTYQSIFKNPIAAPDLLGASSGSAFGASLAIMLGFSTTGIALSAFVLGLITIFLVMFIGKRAKGDPITCLILAGIIIGSLFSSATSWMKLVADPNNQLPAITYWLMGSVANTTMSEIGKVFIPMGIGLFILLVFRNQLDYLTLDEQEAQSMGVNTQKIRTILLLTATLLTASSVAVSGTISWVGLVIPHITRRLIGNRSRILLPASMLSGALFLVLIDTISRTLLSTEIPIGILTSFIGAPFFIYLITAKEVYKSA